MFDAVNNAMREAYGVNVNTDYVLNYNIKELLTKESHPDLGFVFVSLSVDTDEGLYLLGGFDVEVGEEGVIGMTSESCHMLKSGCHGIGEDMGIDIEVADDMFEDIYDAALEAVVDEGIGSKADFDVKLEEQEAGKSLGM